jgi:hypothetical protein
MSARADTSIMERGCDCLECCTDLIAMVLRLGCYLLSSGGFSTYLELCHGAATTSDNKELVLFLRTKLGRILHAAFEVVLGSG